MPPLLFWILDKFGCLVVLIVKKDGMGRKVNQSTAPFISVPVQQPEYKSRY
jgi:hypothetical protein